MTMTQDKPALNLEPLPMKVSVRCTAMTRSNGEMCNQLIFRGEISIFVGVITFKCPRCKTMAEYR